jgi:hypothetical protein
MYWFGGAVTFRGLQGGVSPGSKPESAEVPLPLAPPEAPVPPMATPALAPVLDIAPAPALAPLVGAPLAPPVDPPLTCPFEPLLCPAAPTTAFVPEPPLVATPTVPLEAPAPEPPPGDTAPEVALPLPTTTAVWSAGDAQAPAPSMERTTSAHEIGPNNGLAGCLVRRTNGHNTSIVSSEPAHCRSRRIVLSARRVGSQAGVNGSYLGEAVCKPISAVTGTPNDCTLTAAKPPRAPSLAVSLVSACHPCDAKPAFLLSPSTFGAGAPA